MAHSPLPKSRSLFQILTALAFPFRKAESTLPHPLKKAPRKTQSTPSKHSSLWSSEDEIRRATLNLYQTTQSLTLNPNITLLILILVLHLWMSYISQYLIHFFPYILRKLFYLSAKLHLAINPLNQCMFRL